MMTPKDLHTAPDESLLEELDEIPEDIPPIHVGITVAYLVVLVIGGVWCYASGRVLIDSLAPRELLIDLPLAVLVGGFVVGTFGLIWKHTQHFRDLENEFATRLGNLSLEGVLRLALVSSVAEEIFFRGAFQPMLTDQLGSVTWGYVLTSIAFGVLHTGPHRAYFGWTLFATAAGFILGGTYLLTGNIIVPIIIHFTINAVNMWLIMVRARSRR